MGGGLNARACTNTHELPPPPFHTHTQSTTIGSSLGKHRRLAAEAKENKTSKGGNYRREGEWWAWQGRKDRGAQGMGVEPVNVAVGGVHGEAVAKLIEEFGQYLNCRSVAFGQVATSPTKVWRERKGKAREEGFSLSQRGGEEGLREG